MMTLYKKYKVFFLSYLALLVVISLIALLAVQHEERNASERARVASRNLAALIESGLNARFQKVELSLRSGLSYYQHQLAQGTVHAERINEFITELERNTRSVDGIRILDRQGIVRYGSHLPAGKLTDLSDREFFKQARDVASAEVFFSGPLFARIAQKWVMVLALRIEDDDHQFAGVIYGNVAADELKSALTALQLGAKDAAVIRTRDLTVVQRLPSIAGDVGSTKVGADLRAAVNANPQSGYYIGATSLDQVLRVVSYQRLSDYPLYSIVGLAPDSPLHGGAAQTGLILLLALMAGGVSALVMWVVARAKQGVETRLAESTRAARELEKSLHVRETLNAQLVAVTEELRVSNTRLESAVTAAESANRSKSVFLATMSHEIRTPLNAIVGTSYLLGLSELSPEQGRDVQAISSSSKTLLALVNDVLDFSKIEADELVLDNRPFLLADLLRYLGAMFRPLAQNKGLTLVLPVLDRALLATLNGDADRLQQILVNLLNNAIKFTHQGSVTLDVAQLADSSDGLSHLSFKVTDTGIGISPDFMPQLFEPFHQADASTSRTYGGSGLGLSIVKRIAELMDGSVTVSSQVGQGTSFEVQLPFMRGSAAASGRESADLSRMLNVLVAEDDPIEQSLFVQACGDFGWAVECTNNGLDMVRMVEAHLAQNNPIDCIVLDWRMPELDGVQALEELARRVGPKAMPSVIMVTASDKQALWQAIHEVKPDSVLTKPVNRSVLFNSVNEAVVAHGKDMSHVIAATAVRGGHALWLAGVRVLVVDDSAMNLEVIRRILESEGAEAVVCDSGEAALRVYRAEGPFDAVLMDLQMPGKDGYEVTRALRALDPQDHTPIIALTAGATVTEKTRARVSGMKDFLTKPVDPIRLIRVLRAQIEGRRGQPLKLQPAAAAGVSARPADTQPVAPDSSSLPAFPSSRPWPALAGIDSKLASTMMGGDVQFFREILVAFGQEHESTRATLKQLIDQGRYPQLAALAHKLAGQAGNIGAVVLQRAAAELEHASRDDTARAAEILATVDAALAEILAATA
ncbi:MAG: hypothetical protein RIQ60_3644 [Pseudomonadota bacterium]|jgi:signal transduction histidine kinase/CheY-like chemotaxis protein